MCVCGWSVLRLWVLCFLYIGSCHSCDWTCQFVVFLHLQTWLRSLCLRWSPSWRRCWSPSLSWSSAGWATRTMNEAWTKHGMRGMSPDLCWFCCVFLSQLSILQETKEVDNVDTSWSKLIVVVSNGLGMPTSWSDKSTCLFDVLVQCRLQGDTHILYYYIYYIYVYIYILYIYIIYIYRGTLHWGIFSLVYMLGGSARLGILATLNLSQISEFALATQMQSLPIYAALASCAAQISADMKIYEIIGIQIWYVMTFHDDDLLISFRFESLVLVQKRIHIIDYLAELKAFGISVFVQTKDAPQIQAPRWFVHLEPLLQWFLLKPEVTGEIIGIRWDQNSYLHEHTLGFCFKMF